MRFFLFFFFALHCMAMYDIGFTITESHMKRTDRELTVFFFSSYFIYQVMKKKLKRILRFYLLKNGCNANVQRDVRKFHSSSFKYKQKKTAFLFPIANWPS